MFNFLDSNAPPIEEWPFGGRRKGISEEERKEER